MRKFSGLFIITIILFSCARPPEPPPVLPVPTEAQLAWQDMGFYGFIHFGPNTFLDQEWGYGDADPADFNPTQLDCEQWVKVAKDAGMKGLILTAKHHDGFCLWPTATTDYSVKASPWKNGQGDLVAELAAACRKHDLKIGLYCSPWDRNHPDYGTDAYLEVYRAQLKELCTLYGPLFEIWFDGANGGDGYYGGARTVRSVDRENYYHWPETWEMVRQWQPKAVMFSDAGPDVRWVGNEQGWAEVTNWSPFLRDEAWPGWPRYAENRSGHEQGTHWVPAEADVSIRPGWFYHASQDSMVKSVEALTEIYFNSVGRNANLLLNLPVDRRGLVHETDAERLTEFAHRIRSWFQNDLALGRPARASQIRGKHRRFDAANVTDGCPLSYWSMDTAAETGWLEVDLGQPQPVNCIKLQEVIRLGQRVQAFKVEVRQNGQWRVVSRGSTIGHKRLLRFKTLTADAVRVRITAAKSCPCIHTLGLYCLPDIDKAVNN